MHGTNIKFKLLDLKVIGYMFRFSRIHHQTSYSNPTKYILVCACTLWDTVMRTHTPVRTVTGLTMVPSEPKHVDYDF
jgi:hypothetical protein